MTEAQGEQEAARLASQEERARWMNVVSSLRSAARQHQTPGAIFRVAMDAADRIELEVIVVFERIANGFAD